MLTPLKYILTLSTTAIILIATVFTVNIIFDPLWYLEGNLINGNNYAFNERHSKTNQYLKTYTTKNYDCIIFGSSRSTLLNESLLKNNFNCFNYAFSAGRVFEFTAFAKWLKNRGANPKYIIVGVDGFNFDITPKDELEIPDYIITNSTPPNIFKNYISLDAFKMSIRQYTGQVNHVKIYDKYFIGTVIKNPPVYKPTIKSTANILTETGKITSVKVNMSVINEYKKLLNIFPDAITIGYVPPVSAWRIASKSSESFYNQLANIYKAAHRFDKFYDFAVPGVITNNPDNTYDGSHYLPAINNKIVETLKGQEQTFGINVKTLTREKYTQIYKDALNKYRNIYLKSDFSN